MASIFRCGLGRDVECHPGKPPLAPWAFDPRFLQLLGRPVPGPPRQPAVLRIIDTDDDDGADQDADAAGRHQ